MYLNKSPESLTVQINCLFKIHIYILLQTFFGNKCGKNRILCYHDTCKISENNIGDRTIATNDNRNNRNQAIMNERIRSKEVRLIDQNGENKGVVPTSKALQMAYDEDLDLVLINPNQDPPVAKILNYGKYKYELEKRAKEAKKKQHTVDVKEIKIRYKIDTHDYQVRIKSIEKFIAQGNKVKIVVMLRGREMQHSNLAFDLANKFVKDLENMPVVIEKKPQLEGRNVTLYIAPHNS
ncbi:MAG TPA: translation initiation factor IF-3 [Candidatus Stercorousia faecigallinarum]|nr:translation initiation factor IF-3 [Candidatus Stercorousia faecigallinarum]